LAEWNNFKPLENNSKPLEKKYIEDLCVVYVMYFDEEKGHVPLLICPDDKYKDNKKYMRPIKYHSIWFLPVDEQEALDHVDLEYKGFIFFGKKFLTKSKRKKRRAGLQEETPETIVIIVSLKNDIEIFGHDLIRELTLKIRENFDDKLFQIIESEIAKEEVIKTAKVKKIIENGTKVHDDLRELVANIITDYFSDVVKQTDIKSINQQKAISYLALKGIDVTHIFGPQGIEGFSNIKIFDPSKKSGPDFNFKNQFKIMQINVIEDSQELEIMVKNNTEKEINNAKVNITHVKDYFEKEIMNQEIDLWFPEEELLFISPIIPHINEYLFFIKNKNNKENFLSKRIDLNLIDKN
jgi:hypothetical protein